MSLTELIVEGAYYERKDGQVCGPAIPDPRFHKIACLWRVGPYLFSQHGTSADTIQACGPRLTRRVYIVPTDPAEVVAKLRQCDLGSDNHYMAGMAVGYHNAADLVAEKLGVE